MRKLVRRAILLATVSLVAAAGLWISLSAPYRGFPGETFVQFERGAGTLAMGEALARAGVVRYAWQFWVARAMNPAAKLQAGEYRFAEAASVREVFSRIARGDVYYFELTVPEGSNMFDIARLAEERGVGSAEEFLRAAANPGLVQDLAPRARTLEGYLFPATYRLQHSTTPADLCRMMTQQFRHAWDQLQAGAGTGVHQAVTLASLVEKETGLAGERPVVAGVFVNRLKQHMRLECDPTTIYAALLEHRYRGAIHRSDLDSRNPYNTYQNDGLPPGPIASPGADALRAALHPAETEYLYFVARPGGGGHVFSATLEAHEKAVRSYRHGAQTHRAPEGETKKTPRKAG